MGRISELWNDKGRFWEVFRFLAVGGACFLLEYVLLYVLTEYAGLMYLYSSAIAFTVSLIVNYILCVFVVFHAQHQSEKQMILFIVTSLMGLGINQLVMWFFVEIIGIWYMAAKVVASAVVMVWNYFTKRFILHGSL